MKSGKLIMLILSITLAFPWLAGAQDREYSLAIVPQKSAMTTANNWIPFAQKLSQETGLNIKIKTYYTTIPQFESDLMNSGPDFVYMNPYHMVMAHAQYVPLVRDKTPLVGILVAQKNSSIQSARDLNGKTIAFPAPNAFAASLYMRALLTKENIHFTPKYVQSHGNVYRNVALGTTDGGGGVEDTLNSESPDIKNALKIVYQTPGQVSHPLAANKRVPEEMRKKVMHAILKMSREVANQQLFKNIEIDEPVAADYQRDYAPLQKLGIEKFVVKEQ